MQKQYLFHALLVYTVVATITLVIQPAMFYDESGNAREFKTGGDGTIFPLWLFMIVLGFASYALMIFIQIILSSKIPRN